jgi:hypothetical protein
MCEGETEKNYFQAMKEDDDFKLILSAVHPYVVAAKNSSPEQVVKEAADRAEKAEKEANAYEKVWLVFDHDNHPNRKTAYNEAQKKKFDVAFSAIAFENWFLLHFVKSAKSFSSAEALIDELRKHYPGYKKARLNDFANLKDKLNKAIGMQPGLEIRLRTTTNISQTIIPGLI